MSLRTLITVPASVRRGDVIEVRALAQHPMETGYRRGGDGEWLPRDLLRRLEARFDGELVFSAELHAAMAANPYLAFWLRVPAGGVLTLDWQGDRGVLHRDSRRIEAA
jgi:sulfur-oxidizing protein SoxZ